MLRVEGLTRLGLGPFNFQVDDGQCLAITGPSGAGKSVLLRAIADLDPNSGRISTGSRERDAISAPEWRRAVALVPAESGWWEDNVAAHFPEPDSVVAQLPELGLPKEAMGWDVARLSSGERHRLAILRALTTGPEALLLDEPTAALDRETTSLVEDLIREKMSLGTTVLLVTHDTEQPARIGANVMRLENGRLGPVETGAAA